MDQESLSAEIEKTKRRIKEFHSKPLMLNGLDPYKLQQTLEEKPYLSLYKFEQNATTTQPCSSSQSYRKTGNLKPQINQSLPPVSRKGER